MRAVTHQLTIMSRVPAIQPMTMSAFTMVVLAEKPRPT